VRAQEREERALDVGAEVRMKLREQRAELRAWVDLEVLDDVANMMDRQDITR